MCVLWTKGIGSPFSFPLRLLSSRKGLGCMLHSGPSGELVVAQSVQYVQGKNLLAWTCESPVYTRRIQTYWWCQTAISLLGDKHGTRSVLFCSTLQQHLYTPGSQQFLPYNCPDVSDNLEMHLVFQCHCFHLSNDSGGLFVLLICPHILFYD